MNISDYITSQNDTFKVKTGVAIAVNDLLEFGPDGRAYPVGTTDYAAVANCTYGAAQTSEATGRIVAQTQIVASQTQAYHRQALLVGEDGSLYTCTHSGAGVGIMLTKYSASGALVNKVTPIGTGAYFNHQSFFLSNANICVIAGLDNGVITFAIYDTLLNTIKSATNLTAAQNSSFFSSCALSGGGFAVIYQLGSTPLQSRFASYDNAGNVATTDFAVWTRTGTNGIQCHRMVQLSDGNLAVAVYSQNTVSSIGLFYAVLSTVGALVKAFTNLDTTGAVGYIPEISAMSGKFAVAKANGTNMLAFVLDNSGNLQGSGFTAITGATSVQNNLKLLNDGVQFWVLWSRDSDSKVCLTKLPITGTGYVTTTVTTTNTQYSHYIDAFAENGLIVAVSSSNNSVLNQMWVISADTGTLVSASGTGFGVVASSNSGVNPRVVPVGDFAFACMYDYGGSAQTNLTLGKYANTAVIGKSNFSAVEDALVSVSQKAGGYGINEIKGNPSKAFNHSATNIVGNTGTLMKHGVVLKGI